MTIYKGVFFDDQGATAIEYSIIAALISIIAIATMVAVGGSLEGFYSSVATGFNR